MGKRGLRTSVMTIVLFLALLLVGCSSNGNDNKGVDIGQSQVVSDEQSADQGNGQANPAQKKDFIGTWSNEQASGGEDFLILAEDGTVTEYYIDEKGSQGYKGMWKRVDDTNAKGTLSGKQVSYVLSDDTMTLKVPNGLSYKLTRTTEKQIPEKVQWNDSVLYLFDEPITVIDDDEICVQAIARGRNIHYGDDFGYQLVIENKTDRDLSINASDFSINGEMSIPQFMSSSGHLAPGKTDGNVTLAFVGEHTSITSLDQFENVEGQIDTHDYRNGASYSPDEVVHHPFHID